MLTLILAFLEGLGLIISPCILPILPLILTGSLVGSKKRPLGIILGFILSFSLLAYFSRQLVHATGIDLNWLRFISFSLLFLFGLIMLSSYLTGLFSQWTQKLTHIPLKKDRQQEDFWSGVFFGSLISIVWTPCAGPILAAVIVQTVIQKTTLASFFVLLAFALGVALPMLLIVFYGRQLINAFPIFKTKADLWRKVLGVLLLLSLIFMIFSEGDFINFKTPQTTIKTATALENGLWRPYKAPEIEGIESWINSQPLTMNTLKGKVVLIDFWTYSCINCIRTLPYLKDWYTKYHNKGLVIIGLHAPEFDFEKKRANVQNAVSKYEILYPIALDNQFVTWRNYNNRYWPAHYLINKQGQVVYQHFGEGEYAVTENNIRFLLGIDALSVLSNKETPTNDGRPPLALTYSQTPETYLGYARALKEFSPDLVQDKTVHYKFPKILIPNAWALEGQWQSTLNHITSEQANAKIKIYFNASKVFLVMGNKSANSIQVKLMLNGKPLGANKGESVKQDAILVNHHTLYELINAKQVTTGILELTASAPGLQLYAFTFG